MTCARSVQPATPRLVICFEDGVTSRRSSTRPIGEEPPKRSAGTERGDAASGDEDAGPVLTVDLSRRDLSAVGTEHDHTGPPSCRL
jgi:hypothetical protein